MKNRKLLLLTIICSFALTGCKNSLETKTNDRVHKYINSDSFFEVTNEEDKKSIFEYCVNYELNVPGSASSYKMLWEGYDENNKFGPSISKEDRLYTYLIEYGENKNAFFWITIEKSDLTGFQDWYSSYKKINVNDLNNYHFSDNVDVIDGKYLLFAQLNQLDNYKVYRTSNPYDGKAITNNEQLAICLEAKSLHVLKNISSNIKVNKEILCLNRFEVIYNEASNCFDKYFFEIPEINNINESASIFSFCGKRLECYPNSFENMDYCYCPLMGMYGSWMIRTKRVDLIDDNKLCLPRYTESFDGQGFVDLLDERVNLFYTEDVYGDLKSMFLDAFLSDSSYYDGLYKYSLFDYNKITEIIKKKGSIYA